MRKKIFSILKYLLFLGIGVFLIWWQVGKMTELQKIQFIDSLRNLHYIYLIPIIGMALLSHWSRALRWKLLLESMGYYPSTSNTFYATMVGYFGNNFVPRAGEIMRSSMLTKYEKIPFSKAFGTVIIERLFDFISYLTIILITILIQIDIVRDFISDKMEAIFHEKTSGSLWILLGVLLILGVIAFFLTKWVFYKFGGTRLIKKVKQILSGLKEGVFTIIHLKKRKTFLLHTLFIWTMYLMQVYVGFKALDITANLEIGAAFSVLSLSTLAMIISPGGIGAFPVAVQQVLLVYQVDNISFGWLIWGANTTLIILLGLLSFSLLHFKNKNETNKQHTDADIRRPGNHEAHKEMATE